MTSFDKWCLILLCVVPEEGGVFGQVSACHQTNGKGHLEQNVEYHSPVAKIVHRLDCVNYGLNRSYGVLPITWTSFFASYVPQMG